MLRFPKGGLHPSGTDAKPLRGSSLPAQMGPFVTYRHQAKMGRPLDDPFSLESS
jgi:hypothetical protein